MGASLAYVLYVSHVLHFSVQVSHSVQVCIGRIMESLRNLKPDINCGAYYPVSSFQVESKELFFGGFTYSGFYQLVLPTTNENLDAASKAASLLPLYYHLI